MTRTTAVAGWRRTFLTDGDAAPFMPREPGLGLACYALFTAASPIRRMPGSPINPLAIT